ncbi:MAG: hypothetical protein LAQ69_40805 [Acidobacteriia bacterium]|nr:hypothetical protein [Terriglobia bacterium]
MPTRLAQANATFMLLIVQSRCKVDCTGPIPITLSLKVDVAAVSTSQLTSVIPTMGPIPCTGGQTCDIFGPPQSNDDPRTNVGLSGAPVSWGGTLFMGSATRSGQYGAGSATMDVSGIGDDRSLSTMSNVKVTLNWTSHGWSYDMKQTSFKGSFSITIPKMNGKAYTGSDVYGGLSYQATDDDYQKAMATLRLDVTVDDGITGTSRTVSYDPSRLPAKGKIVIVFPCLVNGYYACSDQDN